MTREQAVKEIHRILATPDSPGLDLNALFNRKAALAREFGITHKEVTREKGLSSTK